MMVKVKVKAGLEALEAEPVMPDPSGDAIKKALELLELTNWDPGDTALTLAAAQVWATIAVARAIREATPL